MENLRKKEIEKKPKVVLVKISSSGMFQLTWRNFSNEKDKKKSYFQIIDSVDFAWLRMKNSRKMYCVTSAGWVGGNKKMEKRKRLEL